MARLLTGREAASALTEELKGRTASLARQGVTPKLVILRCGENEADGAYLRGALKRGALCGVEVEVRTLPDTASRQQLLDAIDAVNADSTVHGCLLLRPLPPHLRDAEPEICDRLLPEKDVDGMTGTSAAGVYLGRPLGFAPCTAEAVTGCWSLTAWPAPKSGRWSSAALPWWDGLRPCFCWRGMPR